MPICVVIFDVNRYATQMIDIENRARAASPPTSFHAVAGHNPIDFCRTQRPFGKLQSAPSAGCARARVCARGRARRLRTRIRNTRALNRSPLRGGYV